MPLRAPLPSPGGSRALLGQHQVNVVVSGGAPWGPGTPWPPVPVNTSWLIASSMPRVIFRGRGRPSIRIVTYPQPVPSTWREIRQQVPQFWDGRKDFFRVYREPDTPSRFRVAAALQMGMLDQPGEAFRLEKNAFKSGYTLPGADGRRPDHDDLTGGGTWGGLPEILSTDTDIDAVCQRARAEVKDARVVVSHDPERFLCGYEYFTSLAALCNRNETRRVLFMHTPIENETQDVQRGVGIASAVVQAMVEDLERRAGSPSGFLGSRP